MDDVKKEKDNEEHDPLVLRVRGLPWSASKDDILKFFEGSTLKNGTSGIHLTMSREGRPSGEAYVEFATEEDATKGLEKNNEHLGSRYIEVFRAKDNEMDWALQRCALETGEPLADACVRLRGLPFGCSKEEIAQFFTGLEIVRNGITLPTDIQGRSTGEAYVQFSSQEVAEKAMGKHKEKIGHRYIEIFKSSLQEIRSAMGMGGPMRMERAMGGASRMSPYDRSERPGGFGRGGVRGRGRGAPGGFGGDGGFGERVRDTGHNVHMRGLPFRALERDIFDFFAPLKPMAVRIKYESSGRSSGEADAMFSSHDEAMRAMEKDKEKIQHRYIELFLESQPDAFRGGAFGGPSGRPEPFGRSADRSFMEDDDSGGFGGPARPFGAPRGGGAGRGFGGTGGYEAGGFGAPSGGMGRGFGGARPAATAEFGYGNNKTFAQDDSSFGSGSAGFISGAAENTGFGRDTADRGYGAMGAGMGRGFGGQEADRQFPAAGAGRGFGMGDTYRNGSMAQGRPSMLGRDATAGYGNNRSANESEFYGSGKLFGDNSYQAPTGQGMNMMNPTSYPGY